MKRFMIIFFSALVVFAAGCTDDVIMREHQVTEDWKEAWKHDIDLPVPIMLGNDDAGTKAVNEVSQMHDCVFGMFAMDKDADTVSTILFNEVSTYKHDLDGGRFKFGYPGEVERPKYYPMDSDRNYSFYAYYHYDLDSCVVTQNSQTGEKILMNMKVAVGQDILWGKASTDEDGYNARYIRKTGHQSPKFKFLHPAAGLSFSASMAEDAVVPSNVLLVFSELKFIDIPVRAQLCVADCDEGSGLEGSFVDVIKRGPVLLKRNNTGALEQELSGTAHFSVGDEIFIMPSSEAIPAQIAIKKYVIKNQGTESETKVVSGIYRIDLSIDPSLINPELAGHEAGKYYKYNIVLDYKGGAPIFKGLCKSEI